MRQIIWAIPRYEMVEAIVRYIEAVRDDYLPGETPYEALGKVLIMHALAKFHLRGRGAGVSDLARLSGVPRSTVVRKMPELVRDGLVEQQGRRYVFVADAFNVPKRLAGYTKRLAAIRKLVNKKR